MVALVHEKELRRARTRLGKVLGRPQGALALNEAESFLPRLKECMRILTMALQIEPRGAEWAARLTLADAFPVLLYWRAGKIDLAVDSLVHIYLEHVNRHDVETLSRGGDALPAFGASAEDAEELFGAYITAVQGLAIAEGGRRGIRAALRDLKTALQLSWDDLGALFQVSGETVRRWERGRHEPGPAQAGRVTEARVALSRLARLFKPERLPGLVRRRASAFGGESALDWILRGRITEVAGVYERELRWQG